MPVKSILLISYYFAPQNAIGAVRPTKLAKYLTRMGYEVTVLCAHPIAPLCDPLLERDSAELAEMIRVREHSLFRWFKEREMRKTPAVAQPAATPPVAGQPSAAPPAVACANASASVDSATGTARPSAPPSPATGSSEPVAVAPASPSVKSRVVNSLYLWLFHQGDMAYARAAVRALRRRHRQYDMVLSCYGPLSVPLIARRIRRSGLAKGWVADFRDEASVPFHWQRPWLRRYLEDVRADADAITAVSQGFLDVMGFSAIGQVISNGYDPEDVQALPDAPPKGDALAFTYCGQLYAGHSDLTPFFEALAEVLRERNEPLTRVTLHYAGTQGAAFTAQAASCGLQGAVVDHGKLPREGSLQLQRNADALLVATWNTAERRGVITGKILEYMMADRPVFLCVSGEIPGSEARALVEGTRLGVACEPQTRADDLARMKGYLQQLFDARFTGADSPYAPDRQQIAQYHYRHIAHQMADVLETACENAGARRTGCGSAPNEAAGDRGTLPKADH